MGIIFMIAYCAISWYFLTQLQNKSGIVFFASLSDYFMKKLIVCFLLGWIIIPISLLRLIFKKLLGSKQN